LAAKVAAKVAATAAQTNERHCNKPLKIPENMLTYRVD
jgi:hypothetical protein